MANSNSTDKVIESTAKVVELTISGTDFTFTCSKSATDRCTNELEPNNKTSAMANFLSRTVDKDQKEALLALLEKPGATASIFAKVYEEVTDDLVISTKK